MKLFRFKRYIFEAKEAKVMAPAELKKGGGKYLKSIQAGIGNNNQFNFKIGSETVAGVVVNPDEVVAKINDVLDSSETKDNGELIFTGDDPSKIAVTIETDDGDRIETRLGTIIKDKASKGSSATINLGNIAEAIMGSALTAKFKAKGADISTSDVLEVAKAVSKEHTLKFEVGVDVVSFKVNIPDPDMEAFTDFLTNNKRLDPIKRKELDKMVSDATSYVNKAKSVIAAVKQAYDNQQRNTVYILSDGGNPEKQNVTKVDLEVYLDGKKINLISLKSGTVKQFGQESGADFSKMQNFFSTTLGINIPEELSSTFKPKTDKDYKEYNYLNGFPKVFEYVYKQLQTQLSGDNPNKEYKLVEEVYKGIKHHATKGEDIVLVVLSPSAKVAYKELSFGPELLQALNEYNLEVKYTAGKMYVIEVYGIGKDGTKAQLLQFRSYKQANAVRNIIEMGPLLKHLADTEKELQ